MDSGNSSSMQSSSGGGNGDEEYDSRPDSVLPAFLNTFSNQQLTFFDPSTNYHLNNPFSQSQPLNFDALRPVLRSEPNCTDLDNLVLQQQQQQRGSSSRQVHDHHNNDVISSSTDQPAAKNPKKRTRASRRAPTTVMTTDTTNFRAMVQEFTGIPAPPFSDSSSYPRGLELFGSGSSRSGYSSSLFYPLRPSPKRLHTNTTTPLLNNPLLDPAANVFNPSPSSSNYQLPHNMSTNQNQILSFQSFLDPPPPLHPSIGLPGFGSKPGTVMPSIDELGLSHGHGSVGFNDENNNGCKLNYSASSSCFHNDKSLEIVTSRGEGTVDSWICPAD